MKTQSEARDALAPVALWLLAAGFVSLFSRLPGWLPLLLLGMGVLAAAAVLLRVLFGRALF
jgi:hypothetical protein